MAHDALLDSPSYFQPRDLENVPYVRQGQNVPELKRVELTGNVAAWAEYLHLTRAEAVIPHEVFHVRQGSSEDLVAWVRRTGKVTVNDTTEDYDYSQLVCSHAAEVDDEIEFEEALLACSSVTQAIQARAYLIRERLENRKLLDSHKKESFLIGRSARRTVKDLASFVMKREAAHPHTWYANLISGHHTISGLSSIFEMNRKNMEEVVRSMASDGSVELHGDEVVTLRQAA